MKSFLLLAYEFLAEFGPFLVCLMLVGRGGGKFRRAKQSRWLPVLFALYVIAVFHVTWPGTVYDRPEGTVSELLRRINFIPFSREIQPVGYGLNVVMFLPFGFLVPLMRRQAALPAVAAGGLGFSLLIELSQLLSHRGTDVDDLIMNTLGAAMGYLLYRAFHRVTGGRFQGNAGAGEPAVYLLSLFLGRFALFHHLGLIRLLYG